MRLFFGESVDVLGEDDNDEVDGQKSARAKAQVLGGKLSVGTIRSC